MGIIGLTGGNARPGNICKGDGTKVSILFGGLGAKYQVQSNLFNVTKNGQDFAREGETYTATLTPATGLTIDSVIVTMGGVDISGTSVLYFVDGTASVIVQNVTGAIVIYASAVTTPDTISLSDVDASFRSKVETVTGIINTAGPSNFSFIIITDPHSSNPSTNKSQNVARYLLKNSTAAKLFLLGDYCQTNWNADQFNAYAAPLLNCAEKTYATLGNHEWFGNASISNLTSIYGDFLDGKTYLSGDTSKYYFYLDDTVHKIRYIVLNTSESGQNVTSATQLAWLSSAVQLPTSEWGIIAMSHFPVYREVDGSEDTSTTHVAAARYAIRDALLTTNGTLLLYLYGHIHAQEEFVVDYSFYEFGCIDASAGRDGVTLFSFDLENKTVNIYAVGGAGSDDDIDYDDLPAMVTRTITNTLTGCTNSNTIASIINGRPYSGQLIADTNYDLSTGTVAITMGGVDITSTAYDTTTNTISISSVTGNISITAVATYVAPITEYTASWLVRDTTKKYPKYTFSSQPDAYAGMPTYLSFICCNGTTGYPTGYRSGEVRYASRTTGYTNHNYDWLTNFTNAITPITYNSKKYCYITLTKQMSDDAYALYEAALQNGEVANDSKAGLALLTAKASQLSADHDFWCLDQELTSSNIEDIISRLPAHT